MTRTRPGGMPQASHDLALREFGDRQDQPRPAGAPRRDRAAPQPFASGEPLGVGRERHIVDGHGRGAGRRQRRRVARCEQHVGTVGGAARATASIVPTSFRPRPAATGPARRTPGEPAAADGAYSVHSCRRASADALHSISNSRQIPSDAGRLSAELARIDGNLHGRCSSGSRVGGANAAGARVPAEARRRGPGRGRSRLAATSGSSSAAMALSKPIHIAWRDRRGGVARDFRQRSAGRDHHRHAARHGFEHGQAKSFVERRQHEQVRPRKQIHAARACDHVTGQLRHGRRDPVPRRRTATDARWPARPRPAPAAAHPGTPRSKLTIGRQQHADVLARIERPQEQDVLARLAASSLAHGVRPRRRAGRAEVDALGRDARASAARPRPCKREDTTMAGARVACARTRFGKSRRISAAMRSGCLRKWRSWMVSTTAAGRLGMASGRGRVHDVESGRPATRPAARPCGSTPR